MVNKPIYGRDFDRDKNLTYRPQDESGDADFVPSLFSPIPQENIVNIIIKQHHEMREYIHVIKSCDVTDVAKQRALLELVTLWSAHSQAEENTLYDEVSFSSEIKPHLDEAVEEHATARILIEELENMNFRINWTSQIKVKARSLAEVIEHHLKSDEATYLKMILELLPQEELQLLGREFTRQYEATAAHNKVSLKPSRVLI